MRRKISTLLVVLTILQAIVPSLISNAAVDYGDGKIKPTESRYGSSPYDNYWPAASFSPKPSRKGPWATDATVAGIGRLLKDMDGKLYHLLFETQQTVKMLSGTVNKPFLVNMNAYSPYQPKIEEIPWLRAYVMMWLRYRGLLWGRYWNTNSGYYKLYQKEFEEKFGLKEAEFKKAITPHFSAVYRKFEGDDGEITYFTPVQDVDDSYWDAFYVDEVFPSSDLLQKAEDVKDFGTQTEGTQTRDKTSQFINQTLGDYVYLQSGGNRDYFKNLVNFGHITYGSKRETNVLGTDIWVRDLVPLTFDRKNVFNGQNKAPFFTTVWMDKHPSFMDGAQLVFKALGNPRYSVNLSFSDKADRTVMLGNSISIASPIRKKPKGIDKSYLDRWGQEVPGTSATPGEAERVYPHPAMPEEAGTRAIQVLVNNCDPIGYFTDSLKGGLYSLKTTPSPFVKEYNNKLSSIDEKLVSRSLGVLLSPGRSEEEDYLFYLLNKNMEMRVYGPTSSYDKVSTQTGDSSFISLESAMTQKMTIADFAVLLKRALVMFGEAELSDEEQNMIIAGQGNKIPYGLEPMVKDAAQYLYARGILYEPVDFNAYADKDFILLSLMRAKDKESRKDFKKIQLPYIKEFVEAGFTPCEFKDGPVQSGQLDTNSPGYSVYVDPISVNKTDVFIDKRAFNFYAPTGEKRDIKDIFLSPSFSSNSDSAIFSTGEDITGRYYKFSLPDTFIAYVKKFHNGQGYPKICLNSLGPNDYPRQIQLEWNNDMFFTPDKHVASIKNIPTADPYIVKTNELGNQLVSKDVRNVSASPAYLVNPRRVESRSDYANKIFTDRSVDKKSTAYEASTTDSHSWVSGSGSSNGVKDPVVLYSDNDLMSVAYGTDINIKYDELLGAVKASRTDAYGKVTETAIKQGINKDIMPIPEVTSAPALGGYLTLNGGFEEFANLTFEEMKTLVSTNPGYIPAEDNVALGPEGMLTDKDKKLFQEARGEIRSYKKDTDPTVGAEGSETPDNPNPEAPNPGDTSPTPGKPDQPSNPSQPGKPPSPSNPSPPSNPSNPPTPPPSNPGAPSNPPATPPTPPKPPFNPNPGGSTKPGQGNTPPSNPNKPGSVGGSTGTGWERANKAPDKGSDPVIVNPRFETINPIVMLGVDHKFFTPAESFTFMDYSRRVKKKVSGVANESLALDKDGKSFSKVMTSAKGKMFPNYLSVSFYHDSKDLVIKDEFFSNIKGGESILNMKTKPEMIFDHQVSESGNYDTTAVPPFESVSKKYKYVIYVKANDNVEAMDKVGRSVIDKNAKVSDKALHDTVRGYILDGVEAYVPFSYLEKQNLFSAKKIGSDGSLYLYSTSNNKAYNPMHTITLKWIVDKNSKKKGVIISGQKITVLKEDDPSILYKEDPETKELFIDYRAVNGMRADIPFTQTLNEGKWEISLPDPKDNQVVDNSSYIHITSHAIDGVSFKVPHKPGFPVELGLYGAPYILYQDLNEGNKMTAFYFAVKNSPLDVKLKESKGEIGKSNEVLIQKASDEALEILGLDLDKSKYNIYSFAMESGDADNGLGLIWYGNSPYLPESAIDNNPYFRFKGGSGAKVVYNPPYISEDKKEMIPAPAGITSALHSYNWEFDNFTTQMKDATLQDFYNGGSKRGVRFTFGSSKAELILKDDKYMFRITHQQ